MVPDKCWDCDDFDPETRKCKYWYPGCFDECEQEDDDDDESTAEE